MDLKKIKFNKDNFSLKKIKDSLWSFLLNKFGLIFMSIFLVAAILGGCLIYKYMYGADWSSAQKEEYRMQIEKNKAPFNMDRFNATLERIRERKEMGNNKVIISKDIFGTEK